jgi:hypothetical protein
VVAWPTSSGNGGARPFYLHLAPVAPHAPSIAEPRYAGATVPAHQPDPSYMEADRADKPPFVRSQNQAPAAAQAVDDRLVTHVDVLPTILAAAGVTQAHATLDGRDLLSGHTRQRALIEYWHDANNSRTIPTWASIRTAAYQYSEYYDIANPATVTFREYYNLQADPYQLVNLLADGVPANDPDTAPLSQALRAARQCAGASCP